MFSIPLHEFGLLVATKAICLNRSRVVLKSAKMALREVGDAH
jgi:hypothetical protein